MDESPIQLYCVRDEGYFGRKPLWESVDNDLTFKTSSGKTCASSRGKTGGASIIRNYWA